MEEFVRQLTAEPLLNGDLHFPAILIRFVLAAVLSSGISLIYRIIKTSEEDRDIIMFSLILISVTIAGAMMIIGNNLARAFGLVGAVAIIRFRTAVKSYRDMAFVFLTIVIGMACGLGFIVLAVITAGFTAVVSMVLWLLQLGQPLGTHVFQYQLLVQFRQTENIQKRIESELDGCETVKRWRFVSFRAGARRYHLLYRIWAETDSELNKAVLSLKRGKNKNDLSITLLHE